MSIYLCEKVAEKIKLDIAHLEMLTKGLNKLSREDRKKLYGSSSEQMKSVKKALKEMWNSADETEKKYWIEFTAESIIEKNGDRDFLDKCAAELIGSLNVYHLVRKKCDERSIILKSSSTQGGCAVFLIITTLILAVILIVNNMK